MDVSKKRSRSSLSLGSSCLPKRIKLALEQVDLCRPFEAVLRAEPACSPAALCILSPHAPAPACATFGAPEATSAAEGRDIMDVLPDAIVMKIFQNVPPRTVAGKCSFVSTTWARFLRADELWKNFCAPWGLTRRDAAQVLGGWRGLYAVAFGANLVQCPNFERIHHFDSPDDRDSCLRSGPFKPTSRLLVERIMTIGEIDPEYSARSHWAADGEGVQGIFLRGGVNSLLRTSVTGEYQLSPSIHGQHSLCSCSESDHETEGSEVHDHDASDASEAGVDSAARGTTQEAVLVDGKEVDPSQRESNSPKAAEVLHNYGQKPPQKGVDAVATSACAWGCLKQTISLKSYPSRFLDRCAPLHVSAWCASKSDGKESVMARCSLFRMQVVMLGHDKRPIYHWDSKPLQCKDNKWRHASVVIKGYPQGVRSIVVKVAGKGTHFTQVRACFESNR